MKLKQLGFGQKFKVNGTTWILLDKIDSGYLCVMENPIGEGKIDNITNNWQFTSLRKSLNSNVKKIVNMSKDNLIPFERCLKTMDGSAYCKTIDIVSLLTYEEYIKYKVWINKGTIGGFWLLTPHSILIDYLGVVVYFDGTIDFDEVSNDYSILPCICLNGEIEVC